MPTNEDLQKLIISLVEKVDILTEKMENFTIENKKIVTETNNKTINIIDNEQSVSVKGEYKTIIKIKEILKSNNAVWNKSKNSWIFSEKNVDEIENIVKNACKMVNLKANIVLNTEK